MTSFWVISGIFIVTALLFIVPTLIRNRDIQQANLEHDAVNITVYRDQLAELENDLRNDILTQDQYDKSKQELQQRMLQDIPDGEKDAVRKTKKIHNIAISIFISLTLPLAAVSLYLMIGETRGLLPQAQLANATQMNQNNSGGGSQGHENLSAALEGLISRLSDNPNDIDGWVMLGRTYSSMERYTEAANTYAKIVELIPDNPQILSEYARTLAMKNNGVLAGKPAELLYQALKIDPQFPPALALAGHAEFEQEHYAQASAHWEKLLASIPQDTPIAKSIKDSIAEAKLLSSNGTSQSPEKPIAASESMETNLQPVKNDTDAPTSTSVSGRVTIKPELASKAAPNDTLFIFARAKTGPKMPLAILRLKVSDLPASFTLTDDMAMAPTMKMSSFPEVVIEARISKSGQAVPASGDLQGFSEPVKLGHNDIAILIDKQIP